MLIPAKVLEQRFRLLASDATVEAVVEQALAAERPLYLLVRRPEGGLSAASVREVLAAVTALGPAALPLPALALPPLARPAPTVDGATTRLHEARAALDDAQSACLVVLDGDRPVGVLSATTRGMDSIGVPTILYRPTEVVNPATMRSSRLQFPTPRPRRCPHCQGEFEYYELRPDLHAYACPRCHHIITPD